MKFLLYFCIQILIFLLLITINDKIFSRIFRNYDFGICFLATGNWVAIGCALGIIALVGGPISGGAFNPAVAISMYSAGKLSKSDLLPYIIVEILGGVGAFYIYKNYVDKN